MNTNRMDRKWKIIFTGFIRKTRSELQPRCDILMFKMCTAYIIMLLFMEIMMLISGTQRSCVRRTLIKCVCKLARICWRGCRGWSGSGGGIYEITDAILNTHADDTLQSCSDDENFNQNTEKKKPTLYCPPRTVSKVNSTNISYWSLALIFHLS